MKNIEEKATCSRTDDLVAVLYGEASEHEAKEFQLHVQSCASCQAEMTAFGNIRESIGMWKHEALSGATAPQVNVPAETHRTKSAMAALREFFDLSPLWLKGATAVAMLLFCLFAVLALGTWREPAQPTVGANKANAIYTEQEKDQLVKKALEEQRIALATQPAPAPEEIKPVLVNDRQKTPTSQNTIAKGRRPLTKWEREQLAADLRLLQRDDDDIQLLSEPINR